MSQCARCSVQWVIDKYGKDNVIEVVNTNVLLSFGPTYEIYVLSSKVNHRPIDLYEIKLPGSNFPQTYTWVCGVYSEEHSNDEDCYSKTGKSGFPRRVIPVSIEKLEN